jgi:hypothetical protein
MSAPACLSLPPSQPPLPACRCRLGMDSRCSPQACPQACQTVKDTYATLDLCCSTAPNPLEQPPSPPPRTFTHTPPPMLPAVSSGADWLWTADAAPSMPNNTQAHLAPSNIAITQPPCPPCAPSHSCPPPPPGHRCRLGMDSRCSPT